MHVSHVVFRIRLSLQLQRPKRLLQPCCDGRFLVEPVFQSLAQLLVVWCLAEEALFVDLLLPRSYVKRFDPLYGFHSALRLRILSPSPLLYVCVFHMALLFLKSVDFNS